jgi:hypothetical protein
MYRPVVSRWLDVPVFVAANVLIDFEVIADQYVQPGWPVHQLWHFHSLLIGGLAGLLFGLIIYSVKPLRWMSEKSMSLIGLPGQAAVRSMMLAGLFGVWLHVLIDSFYHYDVQLFWPHAVNESAQLISRLTRLNVSQLQPYVLLSCRAFNLLFAVYYVIFFVRRNKSENFAQKNQLNDI